jgi:predicted hydrocarbon binding protein
LSPWGDALTSLTLSLIAEIVRQTSLVIENENVLYDFIGHNISRAGASSSLLELVRFEYCSADTDGNKIMSAKRRKKSKPNKRFDFSPRS